MQLIQNQMKDQDGSDCQQCSKPNIDPDLLQRFFSIDREEDCSESSDDDDEDDYDNEEEECEDEEEEEEDDDDLDMDEEMMQKVKSFDISNPGIMSSISGDPTKAGGVYFGNGKKEMRKRIQDYASSDDEDDDFCNKVDLLQSDDNQNKKSKQTSLAER